MKYTIYKTTNDINGKFYIGKHQTENVNDSYLGSGILLEKAIKKYGKEHFHKEILFVFDNEEEMNLKEKVLITESLISDPNCYNISYGGEGGDMWSHKGRGHSEETKEKLRQISLEKLKDPEYREKQRNGLILANKRLKEDNPERFAEIAKKRGQTFRERYQSGYYNNGKPGMKAETREKLSKATKAFYDRHGRKNQGRHGQGFPANREIKTDKPLSGKRATMNDGATEIRVFIEEVEWYLEHGWKLGASPNRKQASSESKIKSSGKGKKIIHNEDTSEVRRIDPNELEAYIRMGWKPGYRK